MRTASHTTGVSAALFFCFAVLPLAFGQDTEVVIDLEVGVLRTASQAATDRVLYSLNLPAGRHFLLTVNQQQLDLVLTLSYI